MLHIILLILKIIGIVLACIIGLVLLLLGLILFVSIKYKGAVDFEGKPLYKVKVWWIPGVVSIFIDNDNGKNRLRVKIFGITVKDNGKKAKEKVSVDSEKSVDDTKETDASESENGSGKTEAAETDDKSGAAEVTETVDKSGAAEVTEPDDKSRATEVTGTDDKSRAAEVAGPDAESRTEEAIEPVGGTEASDLSESENETEETADTKVQKKQKEDKKQKKKAKKKETGKEAGEKKSLEERAKDIKKSILEKLDGISEKFKMLKAKKDKAAELFFSPQGRRMVFKVKAALIKLVKHILPAKLKGKLYLGMGDAYKTANILTYIAVFYPIWSPTLEIIPDFQEKVMEGHVKFKGRIRLGYIVWLAIVLIMDKQLRYTIRELKKLKG